MTQPFKPNLIARNLWLLCCCYAYRFRAYYTLSMFLPSGFWGNYSLAFRGLCVGGCCLMSSWKALWLTVMNKDMHKIDLDLTKDPEDLLGSGDIVCVCVCVCVCLCLCGCSREIRKQMFGFLGTLPGVWAESVTGFSFVKVSKNTQYYHSTKNMLFFGHGALLVVGV